VAAQHIFAAVRLMTVGNMYPPHSFGGYEAVWKGAVDHLRARGHEVRVLTTDTDTGTTEPDDPDVHRELRWHLVDGEFARLAPHRRVALSRHNHRVLDRHLDDLKPDVVAWWSMGGLALTMLETVRRRGIPAVGFVHDEWLDYGRWADPWFSWFARRWRRLAPLAERVARIPARIDFAGAAEYVFVSDYTRRHALGIGLGPLRTSVAHSGIDPVFLDPAPERDWRWRLLYVGRLDPRKGVDTAVRALEHLPPEAHLTIAGGWDRNEERRLRELAGGNRVAFAGQRGVPQLVEDYADCDAVVFPVRWQEPWGLVPLEAMGRGRPVVATGRGGSAEYLRDGENALLFDAEDPRDLAAKLIRLAEDPELRARLRANGFETAPKHTVPVFNSNVEEAVLRAAAASA
jgi:glycogen synthase